MYFIQKSVKKIAFILICFSIAINSYAVTYGVTNNTSAKYISSEYSDEAIGLMIEDMFEGIADDKLRDMYISCVRNSISYNEANIRRVNGLDMLVLYRGSVEDEDLVDAFSHESCLFYDSKVNIKIKSEDGSLVYGIVAGHTRDSARINKERFIIIYQKLQEMSTSMIGMSDEKKAQYICESIAETVTYDVTYNNLAAAICDGRSACAGYNLFAKLLFEAEGMSYRSFIGRGIADDITHIFGEVEIGGESYVFDVTNFDGDSGSNCDEFIFSNRKRQSDFYYDISEV